MGEYLTMAEAIAKVRPGTWRYVKDVKKPSGYTYRRFWNESSDKGEEIDAYFSDDGLDLLDPEQEGN